MLVGFGRIRLCPCRHVGKREGERERGREREREGEREMEGNNSNGSLGYQKCWIT